MGRKSIKENKGELQLCREELYLSRAQASDLMNCVSEDKIKKIESGEQSPIPYEILEMASAYKKPELCNWYCSQICEIGQRSVPRIEVSELPNIVLGAVASLNEIEPLINRLIQISKDGKISDDEIPDFALISKKLDEISLASDALNLWVKRTINDNELNGELFEKEKNKLK